MVLAALRERIPRSGWAGLLVKPETVLGWHCALVRRKWLGHTTGSQSQLEAGGPRDQAQCLDPRSGQEVCVPSGSGLPIARSSGDLDSADGAQGKCVRRAPASDRQPTTARLPQRLCAGGRWSDRAADRLGGLLSDYREVPLAA